MDSQRIDAFIIAKGNYFPPEAVPSIRQTMMSLDDNKALMVQTVDYKDPTLLLVLSILVGELDVDRFMLGDVALGILKLITLGGCGIWWLIDLILIMNKTRQYNYQQFMKYTMM